MALRTAATMTKRVVYLPERFQAAAFLEMAGGNVETAVEIYMSSQGLQGIAGPDAAAVWGGSPPPPPPGTSSKSSGGDEPMGMMGMVEPAEPEVAPMQQAAAWGAGVWGGGTWRALLFRPTGCAFLVECCLADTG